MQLSSKEELIIDLLDEIREEQKSGAAKLAELAVTVARLEERVASHRNAFGLVATIITAAVVSSTMQFFKNMIK